MKVQSIVLAKMIKMAAIPTMIWAPSSRGDLEPFSILGTWCPPESTPLHARMMRTKDNEILCQPITKSAKICSFISQITLKTGFFTWALFMEQVKWFTVRWLKIPERFVIVKFLIVHRGVRTGGIAHYIVPSKYYIVVFNLKRISNFVCKYEIT